MATDVEITDPKLSIFVRVPHIAERGACGTCHVAAVLRGPDDYWPECYSCRQARQVPHPVSTIVPISLVHVVESQLYASLRDYKSDALHPAVRDEHRLLLAATLQRFLRDHRDHIAAAGGSDWNAITVVPSTRARHGRHPLEAVIGMAPSLQAELRPLLSATGATIGHSRPNPGAFVADGSAAGLSILVIDDTFTTGARVQSAASALTSAGSRVVAVVPVGRVIDTASETYPEKEEFWRKQRRAGFDFGTCCLESPL